MCKQQILVFDCGHEVKRFVGQCAATIGKKPCATPKIGYVSENGEDCPDCEAKQKKKKR
jgi:hypothetical protein